MSVRSGQRYGGGPGGKGGGGMGNFRDERGGRPEPDMGSQKYKQDSYNDRDRGMKSGGYPMDDRPKFGGGGGGRDDYGSGGGGGRDEVRGSNLGGGGHGRGHSSRDMDSRMGDNMSRGGNYDARDSQDGGGHGGPNGGQGGSMQSAIASLERRIDGVQQESTQALHTISGKENEKFDLIFAILSELQTRQAQLEDSVRSLKNQYGPPQPPNYHGGSHNGGSAQPFVPMADQMGGQSQMQPYNGHTMMGDTSGQNWNGQMQQVVVVSAPATAQGMQQMQCQYPGAQMMVAGPGGALQPMGMPMQFVGPQAAHDNGNYQTNWGGDSGSGQVADGGSIQQSGSMSQVSSSGGNSGFKQASQEGNSTRFLADENGPGSGGAVEEE